MKKIFFYIAVVFTLLSVAGCKDEKDEVKPDEGGIGEDTMWANTFVWSSMSYYYLWNESIMDKNGDPLVDPLTEPDTKAYFEKLRYKDDKFSYITDDVESLMEEESGVSTAMGWIYEPMYADETLTQVICVIQYVYENTPAARAGVKRGDVVTNINGASLTVSNYFRLWGSAGKYTALRYIESKDRFEEVEYSLKPDVISTSPIAKTKVYELENGKKAAYLLYNDYYKDFNEDLHKVFMEFKAQGVSELVLDLRYNTGGYLNAMECLCSMIAPQEYVQKENEIIHSVFNKNMQEMDEEYNATFRKKYVDANLDLERVVILQSGSTYSASEATIIGLSPYMEVVTIGTTSGGKNTTMFDILPKYFVTDDGKRVFPKSIDNWLVAPLVSVYYNSKDYTFDTSDGDGEAPEYVVDEMEYKQMGEIGENSDPLFRAANEYLLTGSITMNKAEDLLSGRRGVSVRRGVLSKEKRARAIANHGNIIVKDNRLTDLLNK